MYSSSSASHYTMSGPAVTMDGRISMVKIKSCSCSPPKMLEVRMSGSAQNPRRLYYKCRVCEDFDWVHEEDVIRGDLPEITVRGLEVAQIKEDIDEMKKFLKGVGKLGVLLYFILLIIVLSK